jgi:hypothetical protein
VSQAHDPKDWQRYGRGQELQFYATDEEVARYLTELPSEFGPYRTVVSRLVVEGGRSRQEFEIGSGPSVASTIVGSSQLADQWLHGAAVAPALPKTLSIDWCVVNGLVLLQHGATRGDKRLVSRIAIIDKIVNKSSGETVRLAKQLGLFKAIAKRLRRDLRYASVERVNTNETARCSIYCRFSSVIGSRAFRGLIQTAVG